VAGGNDTSWCLLTAVVLLDLCRCGFGIVFRFLVGRVDDLCRSELFRLFQRKIPNVNGDHLSCTGCLGKLHHQKPNAPQAVHDHRLSELNIQSLDGMSGTCQGFRQCRRFKTHLVGDLVSMGVFHLHVLSETSVGRHTEHFQISACIELAAHTSRASIALLHGIDSDTVSFLE
jgi:hypothetical protein